MKRFSLHLLLLLFIQINPVLAELPEAKQTVLDQTGTLTFDQQQIIRTKINDLRKNNGAELAVVIIPNLSGAPIEQVSLQIAEKWQLGRQDINDGVLLLIAKDSKKLRIEVGYGLEGTLTDAGTKRIIDEFIVPRLKDGDFFNGVVAGVDQIVNAITTGTIPNTATNTDLAISDRDKLLIAICISILLSGLMQKLIKRTNELNYIASSICAVIGFAFCYLLFNDFIVAIICAAVSFMMTLVLGLPKGSDQSARNSSDYNNSSSSSSSRSSSSSKGSGGSFGGGGSSGSW